MIHFSYGVVRDWCYNEFGKEKRMMRARFELANRRLDVLEVLIPARLTTSLPHRQLKRLAISLSNSLMKADGHQHF